MFCPECGKPIEEKASYCNSCGHSIKGHSSDYESKSSGDNQNEKLQFLRTNKIFHDSSEELIDTLGSGFISSLVVQGKFNKSVLFLSNKRIYQNGKLFDRHIAGKITYSHGQRCVDLREITGITFSVSDPIYRYVSTLILFVIGIGGLVLSSAIDSYDLQVIAIGIGAALILSSIISLIVHLLKKPKWLAIEYAGGMIMTDCNWYANSSIKRFMRNISVAKDKYIVNQ
jgi:hypothetical protein